MSDTPTNDMQPDDMDEFIASLEAFKSADDSETIQEQQDAPAAEAPAQVAVTTPIDPAILEVQRNQIEVSQRLADLLEAERRKNAAPEEPAKPVFEMQVEDLSPEEQQAYADSAPTISKIANKSVAAALQRFNETVVSPLVERNQQLEAEINRMSMVASAQNENLADAQLRAMTASHIPNYQEFIRSPTWQNFLNSEVPNSNGIQYSALAAMHGSRGNLDAIAKMMIAASSSGGSTPQQRTTPGSSAVSMPTPRKEVPKALPYSRFKEAAEQFRKGQLSADAWSKISAAYDQASLSGRVDYNS